MLAASKHTNPVTSELSQIRELIAENTNEHGLYLTEDRSITLLKRLEVISRLVSTLEREVAVHRIAENDRAAAGILDDLVGELLAESVPDVEIETGNVVFPEFVKMRVE